VQRSVVLIAHSNLWLVAAGIALGVVGVVISSLQWGVLLASESIRPPLLTLVRLYFFGYAFNVILPTTVGGDAIKAAYLARYSDKPVPAVGATLMARVVGFGVLLATALLVSLGASIASPAYGWRLTGLLVLLSAAYGGGLLLLRRGSRLGQWSAFSRSRFGRPVAAAAENLAIFTRRGSALRTAIWLSLLFYLSLNLNYYAFGRAIGLHAGFWFYWVAVPILSIVTLLPISLNGYGVREGAAVLLFGMAGAAAPAALSLALLVEVQLLLFALVGAVVQPRFHRAPAAVADLP
jgi:glycosyltransferase 2 family protein